VGHRVTNAQKLRAERSFHTLDKRKEESHLEQVRFEQGQYDGQFSCPFLARGSKMPEEGPGEHHGWLHTTPEDMHDHQLIAQRILVGLDMVIKQTRSRLTSIFSAETKGPPLKLELPDFFAGLVRLKILEPDELSLDTLAKAMSTVHPAFDGRVNLPVVGRAIEAARCVQAHRAQSSENQQRQQKIKLSHSYSETLPVEVVKVDRNSRSLVIFEKSFERFRQQQRELLAQHNEVTH